MGKTVGELQATMTLSEFYSWQEYYSETPFDDHHRFHRPAVLVSQSMAGGNAQEKLDFLVPPSHENYSQADLNTFKAFGVKPPKR